MQLKMKQIEAWEIDYDDWDEFVNKYFEFEPTESKYGYGSYKEYPYEFVADHEANNDSSYHFTPNGKIRDRSLKRVEKWIKDPKSDMFMSHDIFDYIVSKGDLPKGTYYIYVSW